MLHANTLFSVVVYLQGKLDVSSFETESLLKLSLYDRLLLKQQVATLLSAVETISSRSAQAKIYFLLASLIVHMMAVLTI